MMRPGIVVALGLSACASTPDGLLVITGDGVVDGSGSAPSIDVFVGIDRGVMFAPLTETRAFVLSALPDDQDRSWDDPSRPYQILLEPPLAGDADLYVVLRGRQDGRRFGGNLRAPVRYPGEGLYSVVADLYAPGDLGVCPHGTAEDDGVEIELLASDPASPKFDCDEDGVPYPDDCADYDADIRPSPAYPPSTELANPDELMCCSGPVREPAVIVAQTSGPGQCNITVGCPNGADFAGPFEINWLEGNQFGPIGYCDCVGGLGNHPLDCLADARALQIGTPDIYAPSPFCNVAVEDDGRVCPDQNTTVRAAFAAYMAPDPTVCDVQIVWQAGAVALSLRSQGMVVESSSTHDCDADLVYRPAGPPPGVPGNPNAAIGWAIIAVDGRLVPTHTHALTAPTGCDRPIECGHE